MAWIKAEVELPRKPEVFRMSKIVGQNRHEVVGRLLVVWGWLDHFSVNGVDIPVSDSDIDEVAECPGFAAAMRIVKWLDGADGAIEVPRWQRHNGNSAKARALENEAKSLRRLSDKKEENCRTNFRQKGSDLSDQTRGDERREENIYRRTEQTTGARAKKQTACQSSSSPSSLSSENISTVEEPPAFDLSEVDWEQVQSYAYSIARRVPAVSINDQRAWLKYAVLAQVAMSEQWLAGAAESAAKAKKIKSSRQSLFVRALTISAQEKFGITESDFRAMVRRIEIPAGIWNSVMATRD